ncbi:Ulp1 protease [Indivirus ILV1]|uniref:Ulp1 protease n=1 Tax=Indivirus ILV1 TaxID=1977633 RepID=A0A1V0SDK6_9VIRU|nr:Ulp1 protease [Indivirus ILV1]
MEDNIDMTYTITSEDLKPTNEKDYKCAPSKQFGNWSCIPLESLIAMADAFNIDNPNNTIKVNHEYAKTKPDKYKRYLLKQFKIKLKKCKDQICWTKQSFMKRLDKELKYDIQNNTFLPDGPSKGFEWLDSENIRKSMEQKEHIYPEFKSFGAVPYDFDNYKEYGTKNLDFQKDLIDKGKTKIGMVINLDRRGEPGSHWVALYSDFNSGECYYFDSYGLEPDISEREDDRKEITKFMNRISTFLKKIGKKPIITHSTMKHQRGGSECGVYSLSFIYRLLKGESFASITSKRVADEAVNQCRAFYFA